VMDDDIKGEFEALKGVQVPRRIDSAGVVAAGQRRLRRRRTAGVGAFAAVGLAGSGIAAGIDWGSGKDPAPPPVATEGGGNGQQEQWDSFTAAVGDRVSPDLTWTYAMGGSDPNGSVDAMPLVDGVQAGYAGMITSQRSQDLRTARADLCDIAYHPMDPVGRDCEVRSDRQGDYAVLTFADSHQGKTVLVRVASHDTVVTLAQSVGWPHYPASEDTDPTLLPWDLRDALEPEPGAPGDNPEAAPLDELPLTVADQVELARAFAQDPPVADAGTRPGPVIEPHEIGS
jgi:hypothetical protein